MPSKAGWISIAVVWIMVLIPCVMRADNQSQFDASIITDVNQKAAEIQKNYKVPDYQKLQPEAVNAAAKIQKESQSPEFQKQVEAMKAELQKQLGHQYPDVSAYRKYSAKLQGEDITMQSALDPSERIYVFISSSVPKSTLRTIVEDVASLHDPNVLIVMRGFVGGVKYFKPTLSFITSLLVKDPSCNLMSGSECQVYNAEIDIDPMLFSAFAVNSVPAYIYANGITLIDTMGSEGDGDNANFDTAYKISGDCSLDYALEQLAKQAKSPKLLALQKKLRKGFYGK